MNWKYQHILFIILFALAFCGGASVARAQNIDVQFESDPLFTQTHLLPGDSVTSYVDVTNTGSTTREARLQLENESSTKHLDDALLVDLREGATVRYSDTLQELAGESYVVLGSIAAHDTVRYFFDVTFASASGDEYQNGTAGFDVCVGFKGSDPNCVSGTGTTTGPGGGGGGTTGKKIDTTVPGGPGEVLGESTSTVPTFSVPPFIQKVKDLFKGEVRGTSTVASEDVTGTSSIATSTRMAIDSTDYGGICWGEFLLILLAVLIISTLFAGRGEKRTKKERFHARLSLASLLFGVVLLGVVFLPHPCLIVPVAVTLGLALLAWVLTRS